MSRAMPVLAALAIIWGNGLASGRRSDRTRDARDLRDAVARLDRVPYDFGDWSGSDAPLERRGLDRAGIAGAISRRYEDRSRGLAVTVLLVCGRPGPISVHGPEACYAGAGYEPSPPSRLSARGDDDFWMADFRRDDPASASPRDLRIAWSWGAHGRWRAAEGPRLAFAGEPALYKLYIIREADRIDRRTRNDPCLEFARALLPELGTTLFPAP